MSYAACESRFTQSGEQPGRGEISQKVSQRGGDVDASPASLLGQAVQGRGSRRAWGKMAHWRFGAAQHFWLAKLAAQAAEPSHWSLATAFLACQLKIHACGSDCFVCW